MDLALYSLVLSGVLASLALGLTLRERTPKRAAVATTLVLSSLVFLAYGGLEVYQLLCMCKLPFWFG